MAHLITAVYSVDSGEWISHNLKYVNDGLSCRANVFLWILGSLLMMYINEKCNTRQGTIVERTVSVYEGKFFLLCQESNSVFAQEVPIS